MTYRPWLLSGVHRGTKKLIRIERPLERGCLHEHPDQEPKVDRAWQARLRLGDDGNDWVCGGKQRGPEEQITQPTGGQALPGPEALASDLQSEEREQDQPEEAELTRCRAVAAVDVRRGKLADARVRDKPWHARRVAEAHPEGMLLGNPEAVSERA